MPLYPDSIEPEYYPETHVYVNQLGIQGLKILKSKESSFSLMRGFELLQQPTLINPTFDFKYLKSIHHYIFQDIYSWAGKPRSFNMAKNGDVFTPAIELPYYENEVFHRSLAFASIKIQPDKNSAAESLARCLGVINTYHPFPEGNGRTQRIFISMLARKHHYDIDWKSAFPWEMVETFKAAHYSNYTPLIELLKRLMRSTIAAST